MKLNNIKVTNFLIISEADIKPDSKLNIFCGKNKSGKTSVIKAIKTGLLGTTDPNVIKVGTDKAEIMIDLDGLKVQRTITAKGQRVKVTNTENGDIKANPQKFLNSLLGDFSFDPIAFVLMDGKERQKYIRELFNPKVKEEHLTDVIETELLDRIRGNFDKVDGLTILKNLEDLYYARRTDINKQLKQKEGAYQEAIPEGYNPEEVEYNVDDLIASLKEAESERDAAKNIEVQNENAEKSRVRIQAKIEEFKGILAEVNEEAIALLPTYEADIQRIEDEIKKRQGTLQQLREHHEVASQHLSVKAEATNRIMELESGLEDFPIVPVPDVSALEAEILNLDASILEAKQKAALKEKYLKAQEIGQEVEALDANSKNLTSIIDKLRKDIPAQIIKEANIPIEGLRIEGDNIMVGDTSMDNMSTSEQVAIALTIVRELNKGAKLKLLCLDRAESLDDATLEEFRKQIKEDEFQYIVTYVQHGDEKPEGALLMENGGVKEA
jgi:DNA repair exonuclease SbcCD ATPase subunit